MNTPSSQYSSVPLAAVAQAAQQSTGRRAVVRFAVGFFFAGRRFWSVGMILPLFIVACEPAPKNRPADPPRVWDVSVGDLMRTAPAYEGHTVRVRLPAGGYRVAPGEVLFDSPVKGSPPAVVWECQAPPADNSRPVVLVGTVSPVAHDGYNRGGSVNYQVRLAGCRVEPPPGPVSPG